MPSTAVPRRGRAPRVAWAADAGAPSRTRAGSSRPEIHRPCTALPPGEHVETHVRGDPVQPRTEARTTFERVIALPRAQECLLHGVLSLEGRTEHPVRISGELGPVRLEPLLEVRRCSGDVPGDVRHRPMIG